MRAEIKYMYIYEVTGPKCAKSYFIASYNANIKWHVIIHPLHLLWGVIYVFCCIEKGCNWSSASVCLFLTLWGFKSFFFFFFIGRKAEKNTLLGLDWLLSLKQLFIKDICKGASQKFFCLPDVRVEKHVHAQRHTLTQAHTLRQNYSHRNLPHFSCSSNQ